MLTVPQIHIGFTGTRKGMTDSQKTELVLLLEAYSESDQLTVFHHGDCIGADRQARNIAFDMGCVIVSHQPINPKYRANTIAHMYMPPLEYYDRNHNIVKYTNFLVAAPHEKQETRRSGTWMTVRYARLLERNIDMLLP